MGVFTRFKDIVSSNINSMLDRAEEPEKMIRLMIQEMEETSVELKAACAGLMADQKRIARELSQVVERTELWSNRARLAMEKGREDLAREALLEKLSAQRLSEGLE
ncbi:PspA/IM30 family protein, partial [Desulfoprunum benzoelyticum]|uniref:PspA/IM30 family protein n=1 Tax=Desulfoprunum benzoelyticum TaxID=1506996 RepID=UPI00196529EA